MVDFYEIVLRLYLKRRDRTRIPKYDLTRPSGSRHKFFVSDPLFWTAGQHATIEGNRVRLKVCPPKVMGTWNAIGTNDLRKAVLDTAPAVLEQLGITVTPEIKRSLRRGKYRVAGIHVAEHFHLADRSISEFVRQLFRRIGESEMPEMMRRGVGFYIRPHSRYVSYSIYDKGHQFISELQQDRRKNRKNVYERRIENLPANSSWSRTFIGLNMAVQKMVAGLGPRLEIKFGDQFFRSGPLRKGSEWSADTATNLYQQHLIQLELPGEVAVTVARERAKAVLSPAVLPTFVLWALGDDMKDLKMSPRKLSSHRKSILDKMGFDVLKAASATFGTDWKVNAAAVFNWENRIDVNAMNIDELWHLGAPATDNHRTVLQ